VLHDRAEDRGLDMRPLDRVALGDGDEVGAEEDAGDAVGGEDRLGQRRDRGGVGVGEVGRALTENRLAGQELQRRRIGVDSVWMNMGGLRLQGICDRGVDLSRLAAETGAAGSRSVEPFAGGGRHPAHACAFPQPIDKNSNRQFC